MSAASRFLRESSEEYAKLSREEDKIANWDELESLVPEGVQAAFVSVLYGVVASVLLDVADALEQ